MRIDKLIEDRVPNTGPKTMGELSEAERGPDSEAYKELEKLYDPDREVYYEN